MNMELHRQGVYLESAFICNKNPESEIKDM
jgi:hypothetical protein